MYRVRGRQGGGARYNRGPRGGCGGLLRPGSAWRVHTKDSQHESLQPKSPPKKEVRRDHSPRVSTVPEHRSDHKKSRAPIAAVEPTVFHTPGLGHSTASPFTHRTRAPMRGPSPSKSGRAQPAQLQVIDSSSCILCGGLRRFHSLQNAIYPPALGKCSKCGRPENAKRPRIREPKPNSRPLLGLPVTPML